MLGYPSMKSRHHVLFALAALGLTSATALADTADSDPSPAGWQRTASQGVTYYRRTGIELRLWYPEQLQGASLSQWFSKRTRTMPDGVSAQGLVQKDLPLGIVVAMGKAKIDGKPGMLADIACEAKSGGVRYGELLVRSMDQAAVESGIKIVVESCGIDMNQPASAKQPDAPPAPTKKPDGAMSSGAVALASNIQAVGFANRMQFGVGGYMYMNPEPVVLFKDGTALEDIEALDKLTPQTLDDHKRAHPKDWTRWRKAGAGIEIEECKKAKPACSNGKEWSALAYKTAYGPLAKGARIEGRYKTISGGGNVAFGGDVMVASMREMAFAKDGSFATSKNVGATSSSFTTANQSGTTTGRYEIDGFIITLRFANGETVQRTIVAEGAGKPDAIWLDGSAYTH